MDIDRLMALVLSAVRSATTTCCAVGGTTVLPLLVRVKGGSGRITMLKGRRKR